MLKSLFAFVALFTVLHSNAQEQLTIAWDASSSMTDRVLTDELNYLDHYFSKHQQFAVKLVTFNNVSTNEFDFQINNGNWQDLKEKLKSQNYDGATSYQVLQELMKEGTWLIFTDGMENVPSATPFIEIPYFVINANERSNQEKLKSLSENLNGTLINLLKEDLTVKKEQNEAILTYTGNVYSENAGVGEIQISIKNKDTKVQAQIDGTYKIEAELGDTIVFAAPGVSAVEKIATPNRHINVWIKTPGIQLEEVFLQNEVEEPVELANMGYKKVDKRKVGYAVQSISSEDINAGAGDIKTAVQNKFSGVKKGINQDFSLSAIRQANTVLFKNYPLILIDGGPIPKSTVRTDGAFVAITNFIDPNNIADITILKGLAATNQYGSEGVGGVILITTKQAHNRITSKPVENEALVKGNIYTGTITPNKKLFATAYLNELKKETAVAKAYDAYLLQRSKYGEDPAYFIDVFEFFEPSNKELAKQIAYNVIEQEDTPIATLRGMLFKANARKNYDLALDIANHLMVRFPQQTQSYMDVALANINAGNHQLALNMLVDITNGTINPNLDFSALTKIADNEIRNLVATKKQELDLSIIDVKHLKKNGLDARLVFDWSNADAEFELQFVNPTKRFFKWEHTLNDAKRLEDELVKGYNQEEFEIDGGAKGKWLIHVKYLGNRTKGNTAPTFLKCIVQQNYGKPNERTEEHIIRLYEAGSEELAVELFTQ